MVLLVDNFDSFTYILNDYLLQCGLQTAVIRNNAIAVADIEAATYQAIIMSPGPDRPNDAGILMDLIHQWHTTIPMFGVCLGHQAIGEYFGAELVNAKKPMHGKTSTIYLDEHPLFKNITNPTTVMRYHSLILKNVNSPLKSIAKTANDEIMAIAHEYLPIAGVQFHPESILTSHGLQLLSNWKNWINL
jgi:anthranilate synthase/aminodeoxychorismate synthase-like glutamine amidotransferase